MKCPLVTWRQQKYIFFFFLYCALLKSESLVHIKANELKSKPETQSEANKALISQIESVQKDTERLVVNGATRNAQQEIYRLFFGAFERDMLGKGEYLSLYKESDGRLDY